MTDWNLICLQQTYYQVMSITYVVLSMHTLPRTMELTWPFSNLRFGFWIDLETPFSRLKLWARMNTQSTRIILSKQPRAKLSWAESGTEAVVLKRDYAATKRPNPFWYQSYKSVSMSKQHASGNRPILSCFTNKSWVVCDYLVNRLNTPIYPQQTPGQKFAELNHILIGCPDDKRH